MKKAAVYILVTSGNKLILEKKPGNHKNEPGRIVLPGGHVEKGETTKEAALRELSEELGINNVGLELVEQVKNYKTKTNKEFEVYFYMVKNWDGKYIIKDYNKLLTCDFSNKGIDIIDIELDKKVLRKLLKNEI